MMMAQTLQLLPIKNKPKMFKKMLQRKLEGGKKIGGACLKFINIKHFKVNCPRNNDPKGKKEISMIVT